VRECRPCAEKVENARFEREFAVALNAGPRGGKAASAIPLPEVPGYEVLREVSRGGQGIVYEAVQQRTNRRVALKVLRQDHGISRTQRARFEREIEIAAALQHPGIVGVFDSIALAEGRHALVLEMVEGSALDVGEGRGSPDRVALRKRIEMMAHVCDAIHYAHQRGVIHRDLKPSNILVDASGRPRLLDFGVACWSGAAGAVSAKITLTGEFAGTLAYAAPEQVSGTSAVPDLRTDLYSIGVMLFQLSFGRLPYDVSTSLETAIRNITSATPTRADSSKVDEDLWTIIAKSLSKEPDRRYQSGAAIAADLRRYLCGETIEARRDSRWYVIRKSVWRHRVAVGAVAATFIGLAGFGATVAVSNAKLSEALRVSKISQARALAAVGSRTEADELIWNELLQVENLESDPRGLMFEGNRESRRVLWAFAESQGQFPCMASVRSDERVIHASFQGDRAIVVTIEGRTSVLSLPRLLPVSRSQPFVPSNSSFGVVVTDRFFAALVNGELKCVDRASGELLRRVEHANQGSVAMIAGRKGDNLLLSSIASGIEVYSLPELKLVFRDPDLAVRHGPSISEDGTQIAYMSSDGVAHLRDLRSGSSSTFEFCSPRDLPPQDVLTGGAMLCHSPAGGFAALGLNRFMLVRRLGEDSRNRVLFVGVGAIVAPIVSSNGEWLFTRSMSDSRVGLWRTSDWTRVGFLAGHEGGAGTLDVSADHSQVLTSDSKQTIRLFPGPEKGMCLELADSDVRPHDIALDEEQGRIWASDSQGMITWWSTESGDRKSEIRADAEVAFSVDRRPGFVASGGTEGVLRLFDEKLALSREILLEGRGGISNVRFSPDGKRLAVGFRSSPLFVLEVDTWRVVASTKAESSRVVALRWSPDGTKIAVSGGEGKCEVFRSDSLLKIAGWHAHLRCCRAAEFSPDGELLATTGDDGIVKFWNTPNWSLLRECRIGVHNGYGLSFHERGRVIAAADRGGHLAVIDVESATLVAGFDVGNSIMAIQFMGDRLVAAPLDQPLRILDFRWVPLAIRGNAEYWRDQWTGSGGR